jgi:CheY-like chemotaxis protein
MLNMKLEVPLLKTIMVVEDEPDIQAIVKIAMERLGKFQVIICGSGDEALRKAQRIIPDMILLDVMMPGMDGPTTLKKLREIPGMPDVPVVFMTAKVQSYELAYYHELGAIEVIKKPFDPVDLPEIVKKIWSKYHAK